MAADRPILVTAALPYANGPLHLGHIAGAYLPPDLFVRYQRLKGRDVVFVCGSDEHGVAILIRAIRTLRRGAPALPCRRRSRLPGAQTRRKHIRPDAPCRYFRPFRVCPSPRSESPPRS